MPLQSNRRRSLRSGVSTYKNSTPPPKQTHLTPLIKRTNSKSSSTESISRWQDTTLTQCGYILPQELEETDIKYEEKSSRSTSKRVSRKSFETQTLTQAGFVFYQPPVDENMVYDEEPTASPNSTPLGRKRRRNELEEPITRRTRSAKKRAAEHIVKNEDDGDEKDGLKLIQGPTVRQGVATASMPPPKTPQSTRRREVPSSQSPADTPLSTQSRRSRDMLRSPLKAKSVNVHRRIKSSEGKNNWARMGQVADSLEYEDQDEDELPKLTLSTTSAIPVKFESLNDTQTLAAPCVSQAEAYPDARHEETVSARGGFCPKRKAGKFKLEISDSDNDIDETDEDDSGFGSGFQVGLSGPNPERGSSIRVADPATHSNVSENEETPKHAVRVVKQTYTQQKTESELGQLFTTPRPARSAQPRAASRTWLPPTYDSQSALQHNRHRLSTKSPSKSYVPSISSPADIPLPLINKFSPQKSPRPLPETEPQLQNAWRNYCPPTVDAGLTPDLPVAQPRLPTYPVLVQQQQQQQQQLAPVPPSQATTVDITQQSSPLAPGPPPLSSSPQLHHAPIIDNDDENPPEEPDTLARDIGGWEAVRLTDSQLLLDSQMDDTTLAGPPISLPSSSPARCSGGG